MSPGLILKIFFDQQLQALSLFSVYVRAQACENLNRLGIQPTTMSVLCNLLTNGDAAVFGFPQLSIWNLKFVFGF